MIEKVQSGDTHAFNELISRYDQRIMALLMQMLGNREDANDVYQDIFLKVWRSIGSFRQDADLYTWIYRIAVNTAISFRKRRTAHRHRSLESLQSDEEGPGWLPHDHGIRPDRAIESNETGQLIALALDALPMQQRAAFILRFYQEFKIEEIGDIMGCSTGTIKNYLFRATRRMRKILKETH